MSFVRIPVLWYMPYFVYLFMQYRNQIDSAIYGIRYRYKIYMMFQIVILFFQPICDALNLLSVELYMLESPQLPCLL